MPFDPSELSRQAAALLAVYWGVTGAKLVEGAFSQAGKAIFEWLKTKFTKPAAAGALEEAAQNPSSSTNLEALTLQIRKALEEDEGFRKDLLELLPEHLRDKVVVTQTSTATGDNNVSVQVAGSGVSIRIGSGGG